MRISATPAAQAVIEHLRELHGDLVFHVAGGHRVTITCLPAGELRIGPRDLAAGEVYGVPFVLMSDEPELWLHSEVVVGMADGLPAGFSLEAPLIRHFTVRRRERDDPGAQYAYDRTRNSLRRRWLGEE